MQVKKATRGGQSIRDSVQWTFSDLKMGRSEELIVSLQTNSPGMRIDPIRGTCGQGTRTKSTSQNGVRRRRAWTGTWKRRALGPLVSRSRSASPCRTAAPHRARRAAYRPAAGPRLQFLDANRGTRNRYQCQRGSLCRSRSSSGQEDYLSDSRRRPFGRRSEAIFSLKEIGGETKREDKVINVTAPDTHSPSGPPPARGVDPTKVGSSPRN